MDRWLTRVEADTREVPLAQKIVDGRILEGPFQTVDSCFAGGAQNVEDRSACLADVFGDARTAAGMSARHDVLQCRLKPLDPNDYHPPVPLPPNAFELLAQVFPEGVCDYSVPGVGQEAPSVQWLTYENGPGGESLGPPPASTPF